MTDADATRLAGKESDATRLSGDNSDATRLAGESYRTRIVPSTAIEDETRIALGGFQSKLARDAAVVQSDTSELYKAGDMIGDRYEVSAIHHGAMGVVYGCFDHITKLPRALKTVRSRHLNDKQVLSLFENEAAVWISLEKHPYIVRAYLVERFNNLPYVITEYVRGPEGMEGDLRGWLGHPRLTLTVAVAMALQIAQGMQHAVRKVPNLVHRDLKPANILVNGDGKAMVTDFGLVDSAEAGAGTPAYMSPEQWREDVLDARSDIYSYGCILFELFTGHRLFSALTEGDWERSHRENIPVALTSLTPELPSEIDQFVHGCLEKEQIARPQNWDEVVIFFAEWYHRLSGKSVVFDFSSLALDAAEWLSASYSLANLNRYEEMLFSCECVLDVDIENAAAWFNKSYALYKLCRYEEALESSVEALSLDTKNADMWTNKGVCLDALDHNGQALYAYNRAIEFDENCFNAWYNKGRNLGDAEQYEDALDAFNHAIVLAPHDAGAWLSMSHTLRFLKRYEEAVEAYEIALTLNPNNADGWFKKGFSLSQLERYEEVIVACDHALSIDPSFVLALENKGIALNRLQRYSDEIKIYDRVIEIEPRNVETWKNKGIALIALKRCEDSVQSFNNALVINPNYASAWLGKGDALCGLNQHDEAIKAYDRAITINPNYVTALNNKGITLYNLRYYEDSYKVFTRALEIDCKNELAVLGRKSAAAAINTKK